MNESTKNIIDEMTYEQMLRLWRFSPSGHKMFIGDVGTYFSEIMKKKSNALSQDELVQTSKNIGWETGVY